MSKSTISLSLDQAPPLWVPVRFFMTAPLFGIIAALTLILNGTEVFTSRWTPALLGVTHLLTLGYIAMVMLGAMLQLMPVLAATPVHRPALNSMLLHLLLVSGTLLLGVGLAMEMHWLLPLALLILGLCFLVFITLVIMTLRKSTSRHASIRTMRLAVLALAVTVSLGIYLGSGHAWSTVILARQYTDLHLVWGLLGWVGLLVIGIAYQVVPMFQMTSEYPVLLQRWLTPSLILLLLAWSWGQASSAFPMVLKQLTSILLEMGFSCFAVCTLYLQIHRRRRVPDITLRYWQVAMLSLLGSVLLWAIVQNDTVAKNFPQYSVSIGMLLVAGFAISVINGMLYKILPFLFWLHLQTHASNREARRQVPNVKKFISDNNARRQWWAHILALLLLLLASIWPANLLILYSAAGCFAISCMMLLINLLRGLGTYRVYQVQILKINQE